MNHDALLRLRLRDNDIGLAGVRALIGSPYLEQIQSIAPGDYRFDREAWQLLHERFGERLSIV
jgi:hypothetical protein